MATAAEVLSYITLEEYYQIERTAVERSDWYGGEMFAMSSGTTNHSRIKMNLAGMLVSQLKGSSCSPLDSDQRLSARESGLRTYPDASIYGDPIDYDETDPQKETATNPTVLFEVLSDSTEAYDRGLKAESYRRIPSLRSYLLISQHKPHVEHYERQDDGSWSLREVSGLEAVMEIRAADLSVSLSDLYDRVGFPAPPPQLP